MTFSVLVELVLTIVATSYGHGYTSQTAVVIDISDQEMRVTVPGKPAQRFTVSTGRGGIGNGVDQTPVGLLEIEYKVGQGEPLGMMFKGRKPTGIIAPAGAPHVMTSRILVLNGLEESNKMTKDRHIYIHGTQDVATLGTPASGGCIRMTDEDVIYLFDVVKEGTHIRIQP